MSRNRLLAILLLILAFNYVDRQALGLMLQDIKADLRLSDTQLGFLTGIAFAIFYSVMGLPIARWADRGNRVTIISLTTALWSAMVALCGMATSFAQLLLIRVGVAIGEAGCVSPANSLIADHFSRAERPRAVAVYMLGGPVSVLIGYFCAGWLNRFYGWRMTFVLLGLPGLALAAAAWLSLKEPRRQSVATGEDPALSELQLQSQVGTLTEVCLTLWRNRTFRHLLFSFSVMSFFSYGIAQWQPAFFMRSYGLQTGELGTWFAAIYGVSGLLGTYGGGEWATKRAANNERLQLKVMAAVIASFGAIWALIYLSPNLYIAFTLMALAAFVSSASYGPLFATIQTLVPERMRASSVALLYLCANLIGMGLGPLAAGVLSDLFAPVFGKESLRFALLVLCPGYLWAGWHLWKSSRTVAADLKANAEACGEESRLPREVVEVKTCVEEA